MAGEAHGVDCARCEKRVTRKVVFVQCQGPCAQHLCVACAGITDSVGLIQKSFCAEKWACQLCGEQPPEDDNGSSIGQISPAVLEDDTEVEEPRESEAGIEEPPTTNAGATAMTVSEKPGSKGANKTWSNVAAPENLDLMADTVQRLDNTVAGQEGWKTQGGKKTKKSVEKSEKQEAHDIWVKTVTPGGNAREMVTRVIPADERRMHVRDVWTTKNVLHIRCRNDESRRVVKERLKECQDLSVLQGSSRGRFRVAVYDAYVEDFPNNRDLKADVNKSFVMEEVKANNLNVNSVSVLAIYKTQQKWRKWQNEETARIILLVDAVTKQQMLKNGLMIGLKSCRVAEATRPIVCFKCRGFGHMKKDCKSAHTVCVRCASAGHTASECQVPDNDVKCVNCCNFNKKGLEHRMDENHKANSSQCESFKWAQEALRKKIASE
jgi:Zinc knuckle